jgi:hypothetical protein
MIPILSPSGECLGRLSNLDKRKVITAYHKGFITLQECAQILGIDANQINSMVIEPKTEDPPDQLRKQSIY